MAGVFKIIFFLFSAFLLYGCTPPEQSIQIEQPPKTPQIWDQLKITDLATPPRPDTKEAEPAKTINFDIFVLEFPLKSVHYLDQISAMLTDEWNGSLPV